MPPVRKSSAPSHRQERVGEQIRQALSEILTRGEIGDVFHNTIVTIVGVRMSPDLKLATVAILPLGGQNVQEILSALRAHKKLLRILVTRRIQLKYAPDLRFVADRHFDAHTRMDALLASPEVARDLEESEES